MNTCITYAVYRDGQIVAAGSLLDCWSWLLRRYDHMMKDAFDLAESGIFISPVTDGSISVHRHRREVI